LTEKHIDLLPTVFELWPIITEARAEDMAAAALYGLIESPIGERLELGSQLEAAQQRALEYFVNPD
jgi:hypothetical protein